MQWYTLSIAGEFKKSYHTCLIYSFTWNGMEGKITNSEINIVWCLTGLTETLLHIVLYSNLHTPPFDHKHGTCSTKPRSHSLPRLALQYIVSSPWSVRRAQGTVRRHRNVFGMTVADQLLLGQVGVALDLNGEHTAQVDASPLSLHHSDGITGKPTNIQNIMQRLLYNAINLIITKNKPAKVQTKSNKHSGTGY